MEKAIWSRDDKVLRARLLEALGGVAWWQADLETLGPAYSEALAIWEGLGDQRELVNALYNNSFRYAVTDDPKTSDPDRIGYDGMIRALALATSIGDDRGRANVLWGLGNYAYFHDTDDRGLAQFQEALDIFRRIGDRTMEAWSLHMASTALLRAHQVDESRRDIGEALRLFHAYGDVAGITLTPDDHAAIAIADGDLPRAARLWGAARALSSAGGVGLADFVDTEFEFYRGPNARNTLEPAELERYAQEGRAMTLDESVAYALNVGIDSLAPHDHAGAVR
jgi:hypothetical protein